MKKYYERYNRFEKVVLGLIMCVLILMGFAQVIFRFVLQVSLSWAEELMTFLMVWVAYLGSSAATNERKHIIVSMFVDLLPKPLRIGFTVFSQVMWLGCAVVMAYLGWHITMNYIDRGAVSLGGQYPFWCASIIIPLGMALMAVRVIVLIVHTLRGERDVISQEEIIREEIDK
jgi:TRAP-type C4-dicarboxylate transport system permease small subunit